MVLSKADPEIANFKAEYILLGHSGSTAAHKTAIKTIKAIHQALPHLRVVYGGVYPSYAHRAVMEECEEIDDRTGRGEETIVSLLRSWQQTEDLSSLDGVTWRKGEEIIVNRCAHRSRIWTTIAPVGNSSIEELLHVRSTR